MNAEFLAKIMRFVKEKQEKFIIVESDGAEAVVIMPFSDYEKRLGGNGVARLTEQRDSDRINRDITQTAESVAEMSSLPKTSDDWGGNTLEDDLEESRDRFYMEPLE